jgi:hypothetical protein
MSNNTTSNLRALAEVMSELAVYSDRCISGELSRFLACPTASKFDVLYKNLVQYLDDVTLEDFGDWVRSNLLTQ